MASPEKIGEGEGTGGDRRQTQRPRAAPCEDEGRAKSAATNQGTTSNWYRQSRARSSSVWREHDPARTLISGLQNGKRVNSCCL